MKTKALMASVALLLIGVASIWGTAWAMDEAVLTPTSKIVKPDEEKQFDAAMGVWLKHNYAEGRKMLKDFSAKHPHSRWAAEADLHCGCYCTFTEDYAQARSIFEKLVVDNADNNIRTKATLRLGNVAEREAKLDEAIKQYTDALNMKPTWDQFRYANFNARKLIMSRGRLQAMIDCGPVALAACLNALGKTSEAASVKEIKVTQDGVSLYFLSAEAESLGVHAKLVQLPLEQLNGAILPVLAHVKPNHFVAILKIKGDTVSLEDSIYGKREVPVSDLQATWTGKALSFAPDSILSPLALADALDSTGGCCAQSDENACIGCNSGCSCHHGKDGPGGSRGPGPNNGCTSCKMYGRSPGSPTWQLDTDNLNLTVTDTPIWYDPGKGPSIAFTLNYSNEGSNTGFFGRGWMCQYDMKVFFLPATEPTPTTTAQVITTSSPPNDGTGTLLVASGLSFPASGAVMVTNSGGDSEVMTYASISGTTLQGIRRGPTPIAAASGSSAEVHTPSLQVHRDDGRIETYIWSSGGYVPNTGNADYGYRDTIAYSQGQVVLSLRGGGKYYFMPEGGQNEGHIQYIEDAIGNRVTCQYVSTGWWKVIDANGGITEIKPGDNNTVTITIPVLDAQGQPGDGNGRTATLTYTDGYLTAIKDMFGSTSGLIYNESGWNWPGSNQGTLAQTVTASPLVPSNGGDLLVNLTGTVPRSGHIVFTGETMSYSDMDVVSSTTRLLHGITRGASPCSFSSGATFTVSDSAPYLEDIFTPTKRTEFVYYWWTNPGTRSTSVLGLQDVYECGPNESFDFSAPTVHYAWETLASGNALSVTRYRTSNDQGRTIRYYSARGALDDMLAGVTDELDHNILSQGYDDTTRDVTSLTDASGHATAYFYNPNKFGSPDGNHDAYLKDDAVGNEWTYTYNADHSIHTITNPATSAGALQTTYTYNSAQQVTQIDTNYPTTVTNQYDSQTGRLVSSTDANNKTTHYYYNNENSNPNTETRGFLTSVTDPNGNITRYRYDVQGRRDQVKDANGHVTTYTFDDLDRVIQVTYPDDTTKQTNYSCCHKTYEQDENGRRTYYVYDAKVRPYKVIASAVSTTLAANITTASTQLPVASLSGFTSATPTNPGKVVVLDEIMTYTGTSTDGQGNKFLTGLTRASEQTTAASADSGTAVGLIGTETATYGYDQQYQDWMTSLTDAKGHTTYYAYYKNSKLQTIRYPDNTGEKYTYDNSNSGNNLIKKEYGTFDPNNSYAFTASSAVNYQYDNDNRLIKTY